VITVSGGGWGVGDVIGATRVALEVEDAEVLCLCGHNEGLRERVSQHFAGDPRLRVMGFTNRMGDVMAASNVLIHSSAGLTVLEALIRGCPVISYGFGYGHVRVSNQALERFKLAQVARSEEELKPALGRALTLTPEPDTSFAARPSTASLILANARRAVPLPTWRLRTVRAATAFGVSMVLAVGAFTSSLVYSVVEAFAGTTVTAVTTPQHQDGILLDASSKQVPALAQKAAADGLSVSFALTSGTPLAVVYAKAYGDEAVPRISDGGLVSWLHTRAQLHHLEHELGLGHHCIYASSGSSVAQWLLAHGSGGLPVAGAVRIARVNQVPGELHVGEIVEIRPGSTHALEAQLNVLAEQLHDQRLTGVPVGNLLQGSGRSV
jgi:hypothetical protein